MNQIILIYKKFVLFIHIQKNYLFVFILNINSLNHYININLTSKRNSYVSEDHKHNYFLNKVNILANNFISYYSYSIMSISEPNRFKGIF